VTSVTCPNGHHFPAPRVEHGLPTPELMAAAERGNVKLGGCMPGVPVEAGVPECGVLVLWPDEGVRLGVSPAAEADTGGP